MAAGFNLLEREVAAELDLVDTFDIESGRVREDGTTQTLIGVGKYIGRDLYVKFAQAVTDQDREILVEYQINDHLLLQSEVSRRANEILGDTTYNLDEEIPVRVLRGTRTMATHRLPAAVLAALLLLAAPPADAYYFGRNKVQTANVARRVLVTPHFEITHAADAEELAGARRHRGRAHLRRVRRPPRPRAGAADPLHPLLVAHGVRADQRRRRPARRGHRRLHRARPKPDGAALRGVPRRLRPRPACYELVHVFMFDMVFGSSRSTTSRSPFFRIPLWFAEGLAEWYSSGWDPGAEMYLCDAATSGYSGPWTRSAGSWVDKEGQAALRLISERYGEEKIPEMRRRAAPFRGMDRVLDAALGLDQEALDRIFAVTRGLAWPSTAASRSPRTSPGA